MSNLSEEIKQTNLSSGANSEETGYLISNGVYIDSVEKVIETIEWLSQKKDVSICEIADFVNEQSYTQIYIDTYGKPSSVEPIEHKAYLWVDTGYVNTKNQPIFISLVPCEDGYVGHYTGTSWFLYGLVKKYYSRNMRQINDNMKRFESKYERKTASRTKPHLIELFEPSTIVKPDFEQSPWFTNIYEDKSVMQEPSFSELVDEVKSIILTRSWKEDNGLARYLADVGKRIYYLVNKQKTEYYIMNKTKDVIVNIGLLSKFGGDIHVLYKVNIGKETYLAANIITSKADYISNDFSLEHANTAIKPITFFDDNEQHFHATIDEFDLNYRNLSHILVERLDRFPENFRALSTENLAVKVIEAIKLGLILNERDSNYIKPMYSTTNNKISWLMPLHLNKGMDETPELVMVIRKAGIFYEVKTVLPFDNELHDKLVNLSLYQSSWYGV